MVVYDELNIKKQFKIMENIINVNTDITNEIQANNIIRDKLLEIKSENNLENFGIKVFVDDNSKKKWKSGNSNPNVFVKIFFNEMDYVKDTYGLTMTECGFLYSLSSYLLWEYNLLVDKEGLPLNQKRLMTLMGYKARAISGIIKSLEEKKCLIRVWDGKETYFIINPYIMWFGEKINKEIPSLFEAVGYVPMKNNKKKNG